jgi:hypothetical protein
MAAAWPVEVDGHRVALRALSWILQGKTVIVTRRGMITRLQKTFDDLGRP